MSHSDAEDRSLRRLGRTLMPGDYALTDYNGSGRKTRVKIVERDDQRKHGHSGSGIMFRVSPSLRFGTEQTWYDADWFKPSRKQSGTDTEDE